MEQKLDKILIEYQENLVKAVRTFTGMELLAILDANRKLYIAKIENTVREEILRFIKEEYGR